MGYSSAEIFDLESNRQQWRDWLQGTDDTDSEFKEHVKKAVRIALQEELTDNQRNYFINYYLNGCNIPELAEMYGVNRSTVSRTLKRATIRLYKVIRYASPRLLNKPVYTRNRARLTYK